MRESRIMTIDRALVSVRAESLGGVRSIEEAENSTSRLRKG
jgi:hypothetical protein